jgi:hypothetical protein
MADLLAFIIFKIRVQGVSSAEAKEKPSIMKFKDKEASSLL